MTLEINNKKFKKIFEIMKNYKENKIQSDGNNEIKICGLTDTHIAYVEFTIPYEKNIEFQIFNIDFKELIQKYKKETTLTVAINDKKEIKNKYGYKQSVVTKYRINDDIYNNDLDYIKNPYDHHLLDESSVIEMNYELFNNDNSTTKIKIKKPLQFTNELKMIKEFQYNRGNFKIYDDNFYFYYDSTKSCNKTSCDFYFEIISKSEIDIENFVKYDKDERATYNIKELYGIFNKLDKRNGVTLKYNIHKPLLIETSLNGANVNFMLAPVIDEC